MKIQSLGIICCLLSIILLLWCEKYSSEPQEEPIQELSPDELVVYCEHKWWTPVEMVDESYLCVFWDGSYCEVDELYKKQCTAWMNYDEEYQEQVCTMEYDPVCWKDGSLWGNRCLMENAWVEEETELAEIVDGECIYG